jgi:glycine cleavage system regulatory protein
MSTAFQRLRSIPIQYPFLFGMGISTVKTSFSDLLVQKVVEQKKEIDWKRNLAFATFGCFYLGGVQYVIYVPIFGRLFPNAASFAAKNIAGKLKDVKGQISLGAQVFIDQCIHHPLMYFPVFYMTKEVVTSNGQPDFRKALNTYKENMKEDLLALWKVWVPATLVNFAFMPMWARIPCVAGTSLVWTCILSSMRGGDVVHSDEIVGGGVSGASFKLMKEGLNELFTSSVELDPTLNHICVSASGPDKVGWVSMVAGEIASEGGNITHSKMMRMGNEFIMMLHVAVPPEKVRTLIGSLNSNEDLAPLNIRTSFLTKRQTGKYQKAMMGIRIHCVGRDRKGMLAAVAKRVSEEKLSVENITTEIVMDREGHRNFVINCDCTSTKLLSKEDLDSLFQDFKDLKEELQFDVVDIRVLTSN